MGIFVAGSQMQANGSLGWALSLGPNVRCLQMGDISELGDIVAGAFAHPDQAGYGEYLPLVGDFVSFNEIVDTLNRQGHTFSVKQVPKDLSSDSHDRIALANKIARRRSSTLSTWARVNFRAQAS